MAKVIYLVAVDGSEWSDRAALRAVTLAEKTGAEVHFITVVPTTTPALNRKVIEEIERNNILAPLIRRFSGSGVKTKSSLHWGPPAEIIHEQAKADHVNMVFVGRRGRSKIADLLMGSVANTLAHNIGVPIVLVP